jgi:hypothetical protein
MLHWLHFMPYCHEPADCYIVAIRHIAGWVIAIAVISLLLPNGYFGAILPYCCWLLAAVIAVAIRCVLLLSLRAVTLRWLAAAGYRHPTALALLVIAYCWLLLFVIAIFLPAVAAVIAPIATSFIASMPLSLSLVIVICRVAGCCEPLLLVIATPRVCWLLLRRLCRYIAPYCHAGLHRCESLHWLALLAIAILLRLPYCCRVTLLHRYRYIAIYCHCYIVMSCHIVTCCYCCYYIAILLLSLYVTCYILLRALSYR